MDPHSNTAAAQCPWTMSTESMGFLQTGCLFVLCALTPLACGLSISNKVMFCSVLFCNGTISGIIKEE